MTQPIIDLRLDGDNAWPELATPGRRAYVIHLPDAVWHLAVLDHGMQSGKPSIALRLDLPDGRHVIAETSARALVTAVRAIQARYPDLLEDG